MDALDVAIVALRLGLVLVLYIFLLVVLRAATRTLRAAPESASAPSPRPARRLVNGQLRLLVVEPGSSDLPPGEMIEVSHGATFGRADRASVVVSDPTVSGEHARVERLGNEWVVVDLGSTNGTLVNQALVHGDAALAPGDVLGLGNVRLKVVEG